MATRSILYVVFVLPVMFSIVFGVVVMADVLQDPNRELSMWGTGNDSSNDKSIQIIGLAQQYSTSTPVKVLVNVEDHSYDCGNLYITIYSGKSIVTQSGFLEQCFAEDDSKLPVDDDFSEIIDKPGQYELVAEIKDKSQQNTISASGKFTVK